MNTEKKDYIKYWSFLFEQAKFKLVLFIASASDIWNHFQINTRIEDKDEGYQRALSDSRVTKIKNYIIKGNSLMSETEDAQQVVPPDKVCFAALRKLSR